MDMTEDNRKIDINLDSQADGIETGRTDISGIVLILTIIEKERAKPLNTSIIRKKYIPGKCIFKYHSSKSE